MSEIKWNSLTINNPVLPEDGQFCVVEDEFGMRFRAVFRKEENVFECTVDEGQSYYPSTIVKWCPLKIIEKEDISND